MTKKIARSTETYLIRARIYILLVATVCAIPFAGAHQKANSDMAGAKVNSPALSAKSPIGPAQTQISRPPAPKSPQVVLYDQYDNAGTTVTLCATFDDFPLINSDLADDFVVPIGEIWSVESIDADGAYFNGPGPANSFSVFFYLDIAGFPGLQLYSAPNQSWTQNGSTFTVNLPVPAILIPGTYWVEIQANIMSATCCEWGWTNRTIVSNNAAAWQNPSGFFGSCQSWSRRGATCGLNPSEPDQVYRLNGITAGVTPTPTPTQCSVTSAGCGSTVFIPPTDFNVDVTEPVDPATLDASDFTVNGTPADNVSLLNGDMTIDFIFNTSPVVPGVNAMHIAAGAFNCGQGPVSEFTCTFRYQPPRPSPSPRTRPTPRPRP
jgi:hypothetical protein